MTDREVYPGSPLVSVAFELRHPPAEPLLGSQRSELQRKLASHFPLMRANRNITQTVELGPMGPTTKATVEEFPRFINRARTTAVSILQSSVLLETSAYPGWEAFRSQIEFVCQVRNALSPIYGMERVGLRYIDEVRIDADPITWSDWIDTSLLESAVGHRTNLPLRTWQGTLVYGSEPGQGLVLRYGPGDGYLIDPSSELKRPKAVPPAPFFMLDIDSFWQPTDEVPEYEAPELLRLSDQLHTPVRELFETAITDRYRDEVLRK